MMNMFSRVARRLSRWGSLAACGLMLVTCVWGTSAWLGVEGAIAAPNETLQDKAEAVVDSIAPGTAKQVEGKVQKDIGTVQRALGDGGDDLSGAAKQVAGRAKQDIGRTQSATADLREDAKEEAESLIDSVKDFFD